MSHVFKNGHRETWSSSGTSLKTSYRKGVPRPDSKSESQIFWVKGHEFTRSECKAPTLAEADTSPPCSISLVYNCSDVNMDGHIVVEMAFVRIGQCTYIFMFDDQINMPGSFNNKLLILFHCYGYCYSFPLHHQIASLNRSHKEVMFLTQKQ